MDRVVLRPRRTVVVVRPGRIPANPAATSSGAAGIVEIERSTAGVTTADTAIGAGDRVTFVLVTGAVGVVVRLGWSDDDEALVEEQALESTGVRYLGGEVPSGTRRLVLTTLGDGAVRALIHYGTPES